MINIQIVKRKSLSLKQNGRDNISDRIIRCAELILLLIWMRVALVFVCVNIWYRITQLTTLLLRNHVVRVSTTMRATTCGALSALIYMNCLSLSSMTCTVREKNKSRRGEYDNDVHLGSKKRVTHSMKRRTTMKKTLFTRLEIDNMNIRALWNSQTFSLQECMSVSFLK